MSVKYHTFVATNHVSLRDQLNAVDWNIWEIHNILATAMPSSELLYTVILVSFE